MHKRVLRELGIKRAVTTCATSCCPHQVVLNPVMASAGSRLKCRLVGAPDTLRFECATAPRVS